jgi:hypothetical protein
LRKVIEEEKFRCHDNDIGVTEFRLQPKDSSELVSFIQKGETNKFIRYIEEKRNRASSFVKNPFTNNVCLSNGDKKSEVLTDIHLYLYSSYQIKDMEE